MFLGSGLGLFILAGFICLLGGMISTCDCFAAPLKDTATPSLVSTVPAGVNIGIDEFGVSSRVATATITTTATKGYTLSLTTASTDTCLKHNDYSATSCSMIPENTKFSGLSGNVASPSAKTWGVSLDGGTLWRPVPASDKTALKVKSTVAAVSNDRSEISVGVNASSAMSSGYYGTGLVFTTVANYIAAPTVTSLSPSYGAGLGIKPTYGIAGDTITINGTGLDSTYELTVGGLNCATASIVSATRLTCVLPEGGTTILEGDVVDIVIKTWGGTLTLEDALTYNTLGSIYRQEMLTVENLVSDILANDLPRIGTALSSETAVTILGINYGDGWYRISAADLLAEVPGADVSHADYIVRYDAPSEGAVISIPGEIVDGSIIHTFNYTGDGLSLDGLLSAVTGDSTKTSSQWGEFGIAGGVGTYDEDGGLILGSQYGALTVDTTKPVGERYSVGFTVKGAVPQTNIETFPRSIVAISVQSGQYLSWVGIRNHFLHIYSYSVSGAKSNIDIDSTNPSAPAIAKEAGFQSIDLRKICDTSYNDCSDDATAVYHDFNNQYVNIYVVAERKTGTEPTYTHVYINGELVRTFASGAGVSGYGTLTLGDLRAGRNLKYVGSVYDFAFYSEALTGTQVQQNWNYSKTQIDQASEGEGGEP